MVYLAQEIALKYGMVTGKRMIESLMHGKNLRDLAFKRPIHQFFGDQSNGRPFGDWGEDYSQTVSLMRKFDTVATSELIVEVGEKELWTTPIQLAVNFNVYH